MKTKNLILSVTGALLAAFVCAQAAPTAPGGPTPTTPATVPGGSTTAPGGPVPTIPRTVPGPGLMPTTRQQPPNNNVNRNMNNIANTNNLQPGVAPLITNSQSLVPPNINTQNLTMPGGQTFARTNFYRPYTNYFRPATNFYRPYTNGYRPYTNVSPIVPTNVPMVPPQ